MTPDTASSSGNVHGRTVLDLLDQANCGCASRRARGNLRRAFALRQRLQYRVWVVRGGSMAAMGGLLWPIERSANVSRLPI